VRRFIIGGLGSVAIEPEQKLGHPKTVPRAAAAFDEFQRELIVENTKAGLAAARKRGRRGGRPRVLDKEKTRFAEAMLKDTVNYPFVGDVIDHLRIGRTAFYRYFPPDRIRELRNHA
jgi:DNA invertase Pin-like site-specific DNA recombinase